MFENTAPPFAVDPDPGQVGANAEAVKLVEVKVPVPAASKSLANAANPNGAVEKPPDSVYFLSVKATSTSGPPSTDI